MDVLRRDRDELVHLIAAELDKPSVYMGGPTAMSRRKAGAVVRLIEAFSTRGAVSASELIAAADEYATAIYAGSGPTRQAHEARERFKATVEAFAQQPRGAVDRSEAQEAESGARAVDLLREARELLPHAAFAGWRHDERQRLIERIDATLSSR